MKKSVEITFQGSAAEKKPAEILKIVYEESRWLAKRMSEAYANNLKTTLARVRAIATGKTLRSVKDEMLLESPSRYLVQRRVIASRSILFIQVGRKPGKAPIRFVREENGKKIFEPLPQLIEWFLALNIPKQAWMPIARAIGRRGIKPREVQKRAINASQTAFEMAIKSYLIAVAKRIFSK